MNTIIELYTNYPKLPLANAFLMTLDTNSLIVLKADVEKQIKSFSPFSSLLNLFYENYCIEVYKTIKRLLKERAKEEKALARPPRRWR